MINRYWTTFETLAEIERDCKERQLCMGDWIKVGHVIVWVHCSVSSRLLFRSIWLPVYGGKGAVCPNIDCSLALFGVLFVKKLKKCPLIITYLASYYIRIQN